MDPSLCPFPPAPPRQLEWGVGRQAGSHKNHFKKASRYIFFNRNVQRCRFNNLRKHKHNYICSQKQQRLAAALFWIPPRDHSEASPNPNRPNINPNTTVMDTRHAHIKHPINRFNAVPKPNLQALWVYHSVSVTPVGPITSPEGQFLFNLYIYNNVI